MNFEQCFASRPAILMQGALSERLKREYHIRFDPQVAMSALLRQEDSRRTMAGIWGEYIGIARKYCLPLTIETPTRRANRERVQRWGQGGDLMAENVALLQELRAQSGLENFFIGATLGCKGDAYKATEILDAQEAHAFHSWQAQQAADAGADFLYAAIMPALSEAAGMAQALEDTGLPYIISFMIRKNGRLIDGTPIHDAIAHIESVTARRPLCYMTNCIHPLVLFEALSQPFNRTELVKARFHGIQANTSPLSPEELEQARELKTSGSVELAEQMLALRELVDLRMYGGCCGTNASHMEEIARRIAVL